MHLSYILYWEWLLLLSSQALKKAVSQEFVFCWPCFGSVAWRELAAVHQTPGNESFGWHGEGIGWSPFKEGTRSDSCCRVPNLGQSLINALTALGLKKYWRNGWNSLNTIIVISSWTLFCFNGWQPNAFFNAWWLSRKRSYQGYFKLKLQSSWRNQKCWRRDAYVVIKILSEVMKTSSSKFCRIVLS